VVRKKPEDSYTETGTLRLMLDELLFEGMTTSVYIAVNVEGIKDGSEMKLNLSLVTPFHIAKEVTFVWITYNLSASNVIEAREQVLMRCHGSNVYSLEGLRVVPDTERKNDNTDSSRF